MADTKARPARRGAQPKPTGPPLPAVTVARFEEVARLLERLVEEKASVFSDALAGYRQQHRDKTSRPLNASEAAQVTAAMAETLREDGTDPAEFAARLQASGLRAYDEPDAREMLLIAGAATAPAFIEATRRVVALIEMPADDFEAACEDHDNLDDAINTAAHALRKLDLADARARASRALGHFAEKAGAPRGKAWGLLAQTMLQALQQATAQTGIGSGPSSLTGSLSSTGGLDETSSTGSDPETPSS